MSSVVNLRKNKLSVLFSHAIVSLVKDSYCTKPDAHTDFN